MYMCYLDESGTQEQSGTSHFVLLGLAVIGEQWKGLERQLNAIKEPFGLLQSEIHTAWMARRFLEQEAIPNFTRLSWDDRRSEVDKKRKEHLLHLAAHGTRKQLEDAKKSYRKTLAYTHLARNQRMDVLQQLADAIGGWQDARLFAEVVDKSHFRTGGVLGDAFEFAFTQVIQRYQYFLKNRGNFLNQSLWGLLIQDNNETVAGKLTTMMRKFHNQGTYWTNIDRIIETPLFVDSHLTSMVQMADLCAYATRRYLENGEENLLNRFYRRFDRAGGVVAGVRHFTRAGCNCRICKDHPPAPVPFPV